jgi:hypothetical protein
MRKFVMALLALVLMFGGFSVTAYATDCTKDTLADRAGDWVAALGKKGIEKDQILAKRKAGRVITCAQREAQKSGEAMKRKLGF